MMSNADLVISFCSASVGRHIHNQYHLQRAALCEVFCSKHFDARHYMIPVDLLSMKHTGHEDTAAGKGRATAAGGQSGYSGRS